ncbi:MAG: GT4 family glycosyltransferase PelF [Candidatus Omnitrophota bacterium]
MKTDVCLITEGTYPYVYGGVSSWIHNLVTSMADVTFSVVNISSLGDTLRTPKYEIPANILEFKEVFVHDYVETTAKTGGRSVQAWKALREFYADLEKSDFARFEEFYRQFIDKRTRAVSVKDVIRSKESWKLLTEYFVQTAGDASFADYFWTMRFIHAPILKIFDAPIPDAGVYHALCTGYAGLLAVLAKLEKKSPVVLTEHGIYTHERKIEIGKAKWIYSPEEKANRATASLGYLKDLWIKKFEGLGRLSYHYADRIVTLFEGNRRMQIEAGADPSKIEIIPNGTVIPQNPRPPYDDKNPSPTIAFVGRIVPIKDVKTFIRAVKILSERVKEMRVYILGPGDEDEKYFEECQVLVEMLNLQDAVVFTGNVDVNEYYPRVDVTVLTSISEAQPLSILEAMSYGVPVVASDVGGCRELVHGGTEEDRTLGPAGIITAAGNPYETAGAIGKILENKKLWMNLSRAGRARVARYYDKASMISGYQALYESYLGSTRGEGAPGRLTVEREVS